MRSKKSSALAHDEFNLGFALRLPVPSGRQLTFDPVESCSLNILHC